MKETSVLYHRLWSTAPGESEFSYAPGVKALDSRGDRRCIHLPASTDQLQLQLQYRSTRCCVLPSSNVIGVLDWHLASSARPCSIFDTSSNFQILYRFRALTCSTFFCFFFNTCSTDYSLNKCSPARRALRDGVFIIKLFLCNNF